MSTMAGRFQEKGTSPAAMRLLPLRLAMRELRGGLRGFGVFIACMALGVTAIVGVGSLAKSITEGISRHGRVILGGDLSFSLVHREASAEERAYLAAQGAISAVATMRAMVKTVDGRSALVELKAIDDAYPLYGRITTDAADELESLTQRRADAFGAIADPALLARLDIARGAQLTLGGATLEVRAALASEPDKLAGGIGLGPRLIISEAALRASGLLQPGSLVRWHYRVAVPNAAGDAFLESRKAQAAQAMPRAGWDIRTSANAAPQIERSVERFTQYLTLVGLTVLLVGGVGVANSVKHYLDGKREVIATLKALGATGSRVFQIYLTEVVIFSLIGILVGLALGVALPFAVSGMLGSILPLPLAPTIHASEMARGALYGFLTAFAFALWPLGRAHDTPVSALYRDAIAPQRRYPRLVYIVATVLTVLALAALAIFAAYDRRVAAIFVAAAAAVFVLLRLVAWLVMAVTARLPRPRSTVLRLAVSNIHRPGALTPTVVMSLGIGIALLVTVLQIDGNLRRQLTAALPDRAPSFFFLDIQSAEAERFDAHIRARAPQANFERVPMLRGRIVEVAGQRAETIDAPPHARWVLQSDRGITYTTAIPAGSRLAQGEWWPAEYSGPPLVSVEKRIADGLGAKVGDSLVVNVLGREITAKIANLRTLDWESLGINFVLVFSPNAFRGAPHTHIATATFPAGSTDATENAFLKTVNSAFPTVTGVRVKDALDTIAAIVKNLALSVGAASGVTLLAALLVLGGALAAGHRHRVYDAVILKTLGATRQQLILAYALEYVLIGAATALFGVAAGGLAAWAVVTYVMNLPFEWFVSPAVLAAASALAATLIFGLIGTFSALSRKPAAMLRHF